MSNEIRAACSRRQLLARTAGLGLGAWAIPGWAQQFQADVAGVGLRQLPIAVVPFRGEGDAPVKLSQVILADLERSGRFKAVGAEGQNLDENQRLDMALWRQRQADAVAVGSVTKLADGRYDVRFRLWDAVRGQDLGGQTYAVLAGDLRLAAHRIADIIYLRLTGERGIFSTRIAYITKQGRQSSLWVADADGENGQIALASPEPIISPSWSPQGEQLAYVSFEARKPVIYLHDIASGKRRLLANFRGSNSAPAWAPDGKTLAMTLSRDGGSQLYAMDASGGQPRRLTQTQAIDTEPVYTPDGQSLYFVSDRGGEPQIYRMPASGGAAERVTFVGNYNISPALSPDGRWLAYISRISGAFKLQLMELASGTVQGLSSTSADESPSFSPDSRLILYATVQQGRQALVTTTLDGKISHRLAAQPGDILEPCWGPYQN